MLCCVVSPSSRVVVVVCLQATHHSLWSSTSVQCGLQRHHHYHHPTGWWYDTAQHIKIYIYIYIYIWRNSPQWAMASSFPRLLGHTTTHHRRLDSSGRVISPSQRPLPDKTQHSQQTDIHAPGGIRTHNLSRRAAADLRLRPRGHWDRHINISYSRIFSTNNFICILYFNMYCESHI